MTDWIGAAEAAQRLGIKQASLYAYVSRGVLSRRREVDGRASMFDADEVDELARKGRPRRAGGGPTEIVIESALTEITSTTQRYRGYDATDLALRCSFEDVAMLLWTGSLPTGGVAAGLRFGDAAGLTVPRGAGLAAGSGSDWQATAEALAAGRAAQAALPIGTLPLERLQVIVPALAATDQFRLHLDVPAVVQAGKALVAGMAGALPGAGPAHGAPGADLPRPDSPGSGSSGSGPAVSGAPGSGSFSPDSVAAGSSGAGGPGAGASGAGPSGSEVAVAARLAPKLCAGPVPSGLVRVLNAALVLVADHELAASTLAARVAASMRADPYAVVATGLGAMGGALHGGAALGAELMLGSASSPADAPRVVGDLLRRGEKLPGFGHFVYKDGDPRANLLLRLISEFAPDSPQLAISQAVTDEARRRALPEPNIEFALAVLAGVAGMIRGSGEAIFATGRTAGWLAHALEEYERNVPIRPRSVYTGPTGVT
ncbi:MAG TPA: citrate/2-methylcitrate synthase [Streptosporangiaceae bacterium]|nr:citrate/2-methylcitrate synthase [Streptosporangiaceae bacterium]